MIIPEDEGDIFLRNVGWRPTEYAELCPRGQNSSKPLLGKLQILPALKVFWHYVTKFYDSLFRITQVSSVKYEDVTANRKWRIYVNANSVLLTRVIVRYIAILFLWCVSFLFQKSYFIQECSMDTNEHKRDLNNFVFRCFITISPFHVLYNGLKYEKLLELILVLFPVDKFFIDFQK